MKYRELISEGISRLTDAKVPDPQVDARELFFYAFDMDAKTYLMEADKEADDEKLIHYFDLIGQRCMRIPLQHITGRVGFMGLTFKVNGDVLCPRQDTELLVETALSVIEPGMDILDLCTGSGCVIISILDGMRGTRGLGCDISDKALAVAGENAKALNSRAEFVQGDLFEPVTGRYDIITCNPPYIRTDDIDALMPEVKDSEPLNALDGGADGLYYYGRIVKEAKGYLVSGGRLMFEIGVDQRAAVSMLFEQNGYTDIKCYRDYAGNDRVVTAKYTMR